jgi:transcriptional regulator with XRE-family HTH domain
VQALRTELLRRHPDIAFGDWKAQADEGDGQWFVNLRGSNEFQNRSALAVFGIPYQNIGYLQALYQTLTGCYDSLNEEFCEGLQRFIDAHVEADIEQAMERLRALIRPEEQLTFYFVGDYNLSFLGVPVEQVEAFLIAPEAGTALQITRWKIQEAFKQLTRSGEKITQQKLALEADITQGRLSQIASEFGGWEVLRKILAALLDSFNSVTNNFSGLSEEERWLAQTYLPLVVDETHPEALSEIGIAVKAYGVKGFLRILQFSPLPTQVRLLSQIFEVMPEGVRQELREVAMGSS